MRRTAKSRQKAERLTLIVTSVLSGLGALSLTALLLSFFAVTFDLPESSLSALSGIALAAGCFACSYTAAKRKREGGLASGLVIGVIVFAAVMLAGLLTVRIFTAGGIFIKLVIILTASAIGGIRGVNTYPFAK